MKIDLDKGNRIEIHDRRTGKQMAGIILEVTPILQNPPMRIIEVITDLGFKIRIVTYGKET